MVALERLYEDERVSIAGHANLVVAGWRDAPTETQMAALEKAGRKFEAKASNGCAFSNVVYGGRPVFSDAVRRDAARFTADPGFFQIARAHVVLFGGLRGAAVRGFLGTMFILGRPPRPTKVFGATDRADVWLAGHISRATGHTVAPEAVARVHAALAEIADSAPDREPDPRGAE